ncbi:substrate-binding periplasmic protein [Alteromonas antoniana]|uniref:substrate-binding periplasmic protein n=1 Tax=Alteromonas antoniana TaxID=2803813 RepID=UPI001C49788E|nr:transporter substrate-binding domain-containing protein [Alteromonas antoniana]
MRFVLLLLVFIFGQVLAAPSSLKIAVNVGPPWAFYDGEQGVVGIDVDILTHAFSELGYKTEFHLLPYNRLIKDFQDGKFDVASPAAFTAAHGYFSTYYLPFEDVAVSLKSRNLDISSIQDLRGKRVIAYQSARNVLGEEFAEAVDGNSYLEEAEREVQLTLLKNGKTDVVVGEKRLLTYIMSKRYPDVALTVHPIFDIKPYGAIIKQEFLRDRFNQQIKKMQASGKFQEIMDKWQ